MSWGMDDDETDEQDSEAEEDSVEEETDDLGGWGSDIKDTPDEVPDETPDDDEDEDEDEESLDMTRGGMEFPERFAMAVAEGEVEDITVSTIEDNYKQLERADVLRDAIEQDSRKSSTEVYERRLKQVEENPELDDDAGNSDDNSQDEDESTPSKNTESSTDETSDQNGGSESSGWGVDDDGETQDDELEELEGEIDDIDVDNLGDEPETDTSDDTEESETTSISSVDDDVSGIEDVDVSGALTSRAMSTSEAADQPYLWRILGWAEPGKGKTHFGYTMPEPVCIIDTEGKAHNLASKFEDKVTYIWQPDNYDEARSALDEAITVLHKYLEEGFRGTIVVDSMSEMWEWSKQKYVSKVYDGKTLEEVNLSSNMGRSGESDWKVIKRYHNKRFREVMIDTPFHLYWTAMQTDDYEAIMEGEEGNPKKPVGERDNAYKVDQVLRFVEGPDGEPVGQLQKNGLSKYSYTGLRYPTFDKHKQVCTDIRELEEQGKDPMVESLTHDVRVVEGNPGRWSVDD